MKDLKDFIRIFKNAIPDEWCDMIVARHKENPEWRHAVCGYDQAYHPEIRDCRVLELSNNNEVWYDKSIDDYLFKILNHHLHLYVLEYPKLGTFINSDNGYTMIRYKDGEKLANHIDVGSSEHRVLSASIHLNDGYVGGDWKFWGEKLDGVGKGDLIIFPSNFCFEHEITPVTEGERYSILTFFRSMP